MFDGNFSVFFCTSAWMFNWCICILDGQSLQVMKEIIKINKTFVAILNFISFCLINVLQFNHVVKTVINS